MWKHVEYWKTGSVPVPSPSIELGWSSILAPEVPGMHLSIAYYYTVVVSINGHSRVAGLEVCGLFQERLGASMMVVIAFRGPDGVSVHKLNAKCCPSIVATPVSTQYLNCRSAPSLIPHSEPGTKSLTIPSMWILHAKRMLCILTFHRVTTYPNFRETP